MLREIISDTYVNYRHEDSKQLLHNDLPWAFAWLSSSELMGLLQVLCGVLAIIHGNHISIIRVNTGYLHNHHRKHDLK